MELIGQVLNTQPVSVQLQQMVNGEFKNIYPKTLANSVMTDTNKQFVSQTEKDKWNGKAEANHGHNDATTERSGFISATDKKKLDGIDNGANNYSHPTNSGNKHIPSGGSSGQVLKWSADGTATWGNVPANSYSAGLGLSLSGTTFSANFGTNENQVAQGNHMHESNYFNKALGSVVDFNNCLTEGQYAYGTEALNSPSKGYGVLIVYVNDGGTHDNGSNWIWQLAYSTGTNENYIRQKVNSGDWTQWVKMTLNAYDSVWNGGYVHTRVDGVTAIGKYLDFYPTSGGSASRLETPNGTYLQFKGTKLCLMNVGTAAPSSSTCPIGYIYGQY